MTVVFMGSDEFSVPSLDACLDQTDVVAVYTQPDRRAGRGRKRPVPSPVKQRALSRGLRIEQPERFDNRCSERLREFGPDLIVVVAYGHILPASALAAARLEAVNVHASLLPRHRGAAPVAAAIRAGDRETGVTVIRLRPELDAGEMLCLGADGRRAQRVTPIGEDETAGELSARLAVLGAELLAEVLRAFADRSVTYEVQDESRATYAPMLAKDDGRIDWSRSAAEVVRHVRAMTPWPGAHTELWVPGREPTRTTVLRARACDLDVPGPPGRIVVFDGRRLVVATGSGGVEVLRLKPAGRKALDAGDFVRGVPALRDGPGPSGGCCFAGS